MKKKNVVLIQEVYIFEKPYGKKYRNQCFLFLPPMIRTDIFIYNRLLTRLSCVI